MRDDEKANGRLWFRSYGASVFESPPYTKLGMAARGLLFDLRALCSRGGYRDVVRTDPCDLAYILRLDETEVLLCLEDLQRGGFIVRSPGAIQIVGFMSEQERTTSADRMRKKRASKVSRLDEWKGKKSALDTPR